jgi:hypothetical protein
VCVERSRNHKLLNIKVIIKISFTSWICNFQWDFLVPTSTQYTKFTCSYIHVQWLRVIKHQCYLLTLFLKYRIINLFKRQIIAPEAINSQHYIYCENFTSLQFSMWSSSEGDAHTNGLLLQGCFDDLLEFVDIRWVNGPHRYLRIWGVKFNYKYWIHIIPWTTSLFALCVVLLF